MSDGNASYLGPRGSNRRKNELGSASVRKSVEAHYGDLLRHGEPQSVQPVANPLRQVVAPRDNGGCAVFAFSETPNVGRIESVVFTVGFEAGR